VKSWPTGFRCGQFIIARTQFAVRARVTDHPVELLTVASISMYSSSATDISHNCIPGIQTTNNQQGHHDGWHSRPNHFQAVIVCDELRLPVFLPPILVGKPKQRNG
jgi:hypothetical protein